MNFHAADCVRKRVNSLSPLALFDSFKLLLTALFRRTTASAAKTASHALAARDRDRFFGPLYAIKLQIRCQPLKWPRHEENGAKEYSPSISFDIFIKFTETSCLTARKMFVLDAT